MRVKMADSTETELGPGSVTMIPPSHDASVGGNVLAVAIDIIGTEEVCETRGVFR